MAENMRIYIRNLEGDQNKLRSQRPTARRILIVGLALAPLGLLYHWLVCIAIVGLAIVGWVAWQYIGGSHEKEISDRLRSARERLAAMEKAG